MQEHENMANTNCKTPIISNEYIDLIGDFSAPITEFIPGLAEDTDYCEEVLEGRLRIIHIRGDQAPVLDVALFRYQYIPACYGILQDIVRTDLTPYAESGILAVNGPPLELTGRNVVIAIIDTGIRYELPAFRTRDGSSRILAIWDQTNQEGEPPEGFAYGTEFTQEELNENLSRMEEEGWERLTTDPVGHGTKVASVAGGYDDGTKFSGAAPDAFFVVVKLKETKPYLKDFYGIGQDKLCFQENDILQALSYVQKFSIPLIRPLVVCMAIGTNMGDHSGDSILDGYLNMLAISRGRCVVVGGGNEGNASGHFEGELVLPPSGASASTDVELLVGAGERGFWMELWGQAPGIYTISIISPGGETISEIPYQLGRSAEFSFVYADTKIFVGYILVEQGSGQQLIAIRFQNPLPGIWKLRVFARGGSGRFNIWLPMEQFLDGSTYFLEGSPFITLTEPSYARDVLTVSTYNSTNDSFYINSGRGFAASGVVAPDLAAPGVGISTLLGADTGSSLATGIMAGAAADFLQWAVVEQNDVLANTATVKNYLIRGAERSRDIVYPSREWGYGTLNLEETFRVLAGL